jgi:adenylate cyclase
MSVKQYPAKAAWLWRLASVLSSFWWLSGALYAQTNTADSLVRLLTTLPADTHRVSVLYDYAWEITPYNTDLAEQKLWEALALARQLQFPAGEANAWNGLGGVEMERSNWKKALEYYDYALKMRQSLGDQRGEASVYSNLGKIHEAMGDFNKALEFLRENLRIREMLKDEAGIARAHLGISYAMQEMGAYPEAYDHVNQYRQFVEANNDIKGMAQAYTVLGHIRFELEMLGESKRWYEQALQVREKLADSLDLAEAISNLANVLDEMDTLRLGAAVPLYQRALDIHRRLGDEDGMAAVYNNLATACKHLKRYKEALGYLQQSLDIRRRLDDQPGMMETYNTYGDVFFGKNQLRESLRYVELYFKIARDIGDAKFIQKGYKDFAKVYFALGEFRRAYEYRVLYDEMRYKRLDENRAQDFERKEVLFSEGRRQREIERQQHELLVRDAQLGRNRVIGYALSGGALALALLAGLLYNRSRLRARSNRELAAKNKVIERERERADTLLKNILPEKTAEELKQNDRVQPVRYDAASVLFTDFKGFTTIAEYVTPEDLIEELDECFRLFDAIISVYGIEKIKTIGDSYMCVSGVPTPNEHHAFDLVKAAIDMQRGLKELMLRKAAEGKPVFEMRVGINSGPVVAGVVGSHKFAYDIWGDTVNTAARMEQGGEPHQINISESTYQLVKDRFNCRYRGRFPAKNKGEVAMYYVEYDDAI